MERSVRGELEGGEKWGGGGGGVWGVDTVEQSQSLQKLSPQLLQGIFAPLRSVHEFRT